MNKIDKLIKEMCPNGVEYKAIGDVVNFQNGFAFKSSLFKNDGEKILRITNLDGKKIDLTKIVYFDINDYINDLSSYKVKTNDIVIAMSGATTGKIGINRTTETLYLNQRVGKFEPFEVLNNLFLYHFLLSKTDEFYTLAGGGAQPNLSTNDIKSVMIPVPPLPVQEEIVKILDKFVELEAWLEAELGERKKQYEFYSTKILNINNVEKTIIFGEVAKIVRGASPRPISNFITTEKDGVSWIKIGDISPTEKYVTSTREKITLEGKKKSRFVMRGDFILSNSMSFGRPYILKIDGCIHDGWLSISDFEKIYTSDFLYYLLSSTYIQNLLKEKASNGTVQNLNADIVKSLELPLYSKEEQEIIVNILDKFDKLVNDIKEGLPAEIEMRRKQYEYYRNKLLSFDELCNE